MRQTPWQRALLYTVVVVWSFVCLFPFYWLATTSLKTPLAVSRGPRYLPTVDYQPTGEHWQYLLNDQRDSLLRHFRNSLIAATGSTLLALVLGSMGGYGLARYRYHWRHLLNWRNHDISFWIISQRFLPPALFVVPFLLLFSQLNLVDTHLGLILAYTLFNIPFAVWIMRDFFVNLPIDLEESALVDGATAWQAFVRIVLPLSTPGLVSVAIFSFVFSWNEFLYALMLTNYEAITLPVLIAGQNNTRGIQWWYISALTLAAVTPVVLIGLALERYITRGLTAGAVKG
ncbi:MAG: carbohydrate ABC transporter permease [Caldilinea sp.]|jgi:multiple sugar transport system permease protein|nr:carbohydrate ABC transporter permease [Caldilinea sp.]